MEQKMTNGVPWKQILRFSIPLLIGLLLQQLYNTVDTIVVGNFANEAALSAVGTTGSLVFLFIAIANGFSSGAGVIVSQYYGAGDINRMRKTAGAYCRQHLKVTALAFVLQSAYLPLFGVFQGSGDGFAITRTAVLALSIRVLTTYTLCYLPIFSYRIVWWNMIFGFTGGFIITWIHYLSEKWSGKNIIATKI